MFSVKTCSLSAHNKTNSSNVTVSTLPSGYIVYIFAKIYIFISIGKSPFTCFSKVSFQLCCVRSFSCSHWLSLAEILKSYLVLVTPNKMCKWRCEAISVYYEMHRAMPYLDLINICKSYITGHANWRFFLVLLQHLHNMFSTEQVLKSLSFMLNLPSSPDFSLSLQISQCANKPLRSVSEQTELRGEKRIRETWSSRVGVCLEIHFFFLPPHTAGAQLVSIFTN